MSGLGMQWPVTRSDQEIPAQGHKESIRVAGGREGVWWGSVQPGQGAGDRGQGKGGAEAEIKARKGSQVGVTG